jgi:hypothetical protein
MFAAIQSIINPGDEVVVMEPSFDIYRLVLFSLLPLSAIISRFWCSSYLIVSFLPLHPPQCPAQNGGRHPEVCASALDHVVRNHDHQCNKAINYRAESGVQWSLDMAELAAAFTPKTRAIILNTPHNPTGKVCVCVCMGHESHCQVFTRQELQQIADIVWACTLFQWCDDGRCLPTQTAS